MIRTFLTLSLLCASASAADAVQRPNIVVVLIDDMGWADLSCFGGQGAVTENIDRLAAEGLSFGSFYVSSPICSPSRTGLHHGPVSVPLANHFVSGGSGR